MTSLSILNMNHSPLHPDNAYLLETPREAMERKRQYVRNSMTQAQYDAWWEQTPNDDAGHAQAVDEMYAEVMKAQELAKSVTLDWDGAREVLEEGERQQKEIDREREWLENDVTYTDRLGGDAVGAFDRGMEEQLRDAGFDTSGRL